MANIGLVLSGGGARAAYQVGAISALAEIHPRKACPFPILAGLSAGAINSVALGIGAGDFPRAAARLRTIWSRLTPDQIYRTDVRTLALLGARWIRDLSIGGLLGRSTVTHLLDTTPLRKLLQKELDVAQLRDHVKSGVLLGIAVSATNYLTGTTITFFDGAANIEPWKRTGRIAAHEPITVEHVMASAAIPIFFPPVAIEGRFFGDGGVRMTTPTSPAIHLGADKILAIGIRYRRPVESTTVLNRNTKAKAVTLSEISGVLLNALFLDSLDNDFERLERINRTLSAVPDTERRRLLDPLRRIPALLLKPSRDLGQLAADQYEKFPWMLRHLLRGIGATANTGWDLLSYLAFQPGYISKLIELGYEDTMARRGEIEEFLA